MKSIFVATCLGVALLTPSSAHPQPQGECWAVSNIKGYSAYAGEGYKFSPDGLPSTLMLCFNSDGGLVTGSDVRFVKFGASTLAGYGGNDRGNELFEVYQLDRENRRLLYVKTRIGTKTVAPSFSDVVSAFVGDAAQVRR